MKQLAVAVALAGLLLSSCATSPPEASVPAPDASTSQSSPVPSVTTTPASSVAPSELVTPTPSASVPTQPLVLGGTSLGKFKFGASEGEVMSWLETVLGPPTDMFGDPFCYATENSPYSVQLIWDDLTVVFLAKDTKSDSPRTLQAWNYALNGSLPARFVLEDDADPAQSFTSLKQKFPKAKSSTRPSGLNVLTLPNKIRLIGELSAEQIAAGFEDLECSAE